MRRLPRSNAALSRGTKSAAVRRTNPILKDRWTDYAAILVKVFLPYVPAETEYPWNFREFTTGSGENVQNSTSFSMAGSLCLKIRR